MIKKRVSYRLDEVRKRRLEALAAALHETETGALEACIDLAFDVLWEAQCDDGDDGKRAAKKFTARIKQFQHAGY